MIDEKKHLYILVAVWLLLYLLGNNLLVVTDPVECNYVETAREMLSSGDYFSPRIFGNYWFDKPILFYWELIASFKLLGFNDFAARLPSVLMMGVAMGLIYWWARRLYGAQIALVSALILATSLESWYVGHGIVTDMTLLVTISLTLIAFYQGYLSHNYNWYYLSAISAALAVLDKGPIGLCLPGLIILIFLLWQRDIKAVLVKQIFLGFGLFLLITGIWYVPMYRIHGEDFINVFLGVHNVMRATVSEHPRDNVWYYYLGIFLAGFFPWVWIAIPALVKKWRGGWRLHLDTATRFLLVWAVTVFLVFQCFATKYVTYTLPYMFPVVLLMARHFCHWGKKFFHSVAAIVVVYVGLLFFLVVPLIPNYSSHSLAMAAMPYVEKGAPVYCYNARGRPVSFSYYTGQFIYDLVTQEEFDNQEQKLDWSVTDIIPLKSRDSVDKDSAFLIIAKEKMFKEMQEQYPGKWHELARNPRNVLYYHEAK